MSTDVYDKRKSKKTLILILIAVCIVGAVYVYTYSIGVDLKKQAVNAVRQNATSISNEVSSSIGYAMSSIQLASQSASQNMNSEVIGDANEMLELVLDNTPFNSIEYVQANGWNTVNGGGEPFDAGEREYYQRGMQGETGIWVDDSPRNSKETLLNFYTPLYYDGKIVGVFNGTMGGNTDIKPLLETSFSGEKLLGFLCDNDGNIIASTVDIAQENRNIQMYLKKIMGASDEAFSMLESFKDDGDKTIFEFHDKSGDAICCISGVKNADWCVIQIVPSESLDNAMKASTVKSILVVSIIVVLFLLYFLYITWEHTRKNKEQNAEYIGLIEVLGKEYSSVYLVDAESGLATAFRMSNFIKQYYGRAMCESLSWTECIADYASRFVVEEEKEIFLKHYSLMNLKTQLSGEGTFYNYEFRADHNGEKKAFRMIATILPDSKNKRFVLGVVDITEEREKEIATQKTLQDAYYSAQAANEAKSRFLFNMSHDIRTPMNAILGFTNRLVQCKDDEVEFARCVEKIKVSGECLSNLISNVLDLARIESGKASLDDDDFCDIPKFYENLTTVFLEELEKKHLTLQTNLDVTQEQVFVDLTKLEQIFLNILSNAVKYTPEGGRIELTIRQLSCEDKERVCYQTVIWDTGIGMSEEFLPHIFDEFTRERNSTESRIIGTGLGMGITKKLVDLMKGTILVESKLGAGTKVTITLCHRIATGIEDLAEDDMGSKDREEISLAGKRVLVAEDNELNAEIVIAILEDSGCEVSWAKDGIICIDMLERQDGGYYDVILMDIQMPNMDGYKATSIIRNMEDEKKASIKIIAMTANAFEEDKKNAIAAGMQAHIAKPIDVPMFLRTIYDVLNGRFVLCGN
ncbi:MAG: ATP-binding protein [Lachnospiraceae bacterium]|nr:ATP-binding protein [Lachnospiraceae bacterium]